LVPSTYRNEATTGTPRTASQCSLRLLCTLTRDRPNQASTSFDRAPALANTTPPPGCPRLMLLKYMGPGLSKGWGPFFGKYGRFPTTFETVYHKPNRDSHNNNNNTKTTTTTYIHVNMPCPWSTAPWHACQHCCASESCQVNSAAVGSGGESSSSRYGERRERQGEPARQ
jgi:hypothetical protein